MGGEENGVRGELLNRRGVFRVERAIDDSNRIGVTERAQRLSKRAARKNLAVAESESSIDRDQVHVSL